MHAAMKRRKVLSTLLCAALGMGFGAVGRDGANRAFGQVRQRIRVTVAKFAFTPAEITVVRGSPVTLVLTALDFNHGFSCPDFRIRSDLIAGKDVELGFTPEKIGRFLFVCDNFCGEGHDDMSGVIIVTEA